MLSQIIMASSRVPKMLAQSFIQLESFSSKQLWKLFYFYLCMFGFCCLGLVCSVFVFTCSEWPEIYLNYLLFLKLCLLLFLFDFIILFLSLQFSNARIEDYKFSSDNCFVYILHDVVLSWTFTSKSIPYKFSFYFLLILRLFLNLKKKKKTILIVFYIKA